MLEAEYPSFRSSFDADPRVVLSWNIKEIRGGYHVTVEAGLPGRLSLELHEG